MITLPDSHSGNINAIALAYVANMCEKVGEIETKLRFIPIPKGYEHIQKCQVLVKIGEAWVSHAVLDSRFVYTPIIGFDTTGVNYDQTNIRGYSDRTPLKESEFSPIAPKTATEV